MFDGSGFIWPSTDSLGTFSIIVNDGGSGGGEFVPFM